MGDIHTNYSSESISKALSSSQNSTKKTGGSLQIGNYTVIIAPKTQQGGFRGWISQIFLKNQTSVAVLKKGIDGRTVQVASPETFHNQKQMKLHVQASILMEQIKSPGTTSEEKSRAGDELVKLFNNPKTPKAIKLAIKSQVDEIAKSACIAGAAARFGFSKELVEQLIPREFSAVSFVQMTENIGGKIVPYSEEKKAQLRQNFDLTEKTIQHNGTEIKAFIGIPKSHGGATYSPTIFLEGNCNEFDAELSKFKNGFNDAVKNNSEDAFSRLDGMIKLANSRNEAFSSATTTASIAGSLDYSKLNYTTPLARPVSETVLRAPMQHKELIGQIKSALFKLVQQCVGQPGTQLTQEQQKQIEEGWMILKGEKKSFSAILDAVQLDNKFHFQDLSDAKIQEKLTDMYKNFGAIDLKIIQKPTIAEKFEAYKNHPECPPEDKAMLEALETLHGEAKIKNLAKDAIQELNRPKFSR